MAPQKVIPSKISHTAFLSASTLNRTILGTIVSRGGLEKRTCWVIT